MLGINKLLQNEKNTSGETIIELPLKKKKGRKSKQTKILELEEIERNRVPIKLFPSLNEKIFDVIKIDNCEYFLDGEFGIIYNNKIEQVGIKKNNKYIMYLESSINELNKQLELDDDEIIKMIKSRS
jgi:hypothetical protein